MKTALAAGVSREVLDKAWEKKARPIGINSCRHSCDFSKTECTYCTAIVSLTFVIHFVFFDNVDFEIL